MKGCFLCAAFMTVVFSGCSYALKHTVTPPPGMKFKTTVEGQSWGYSGFLALKKAEVRAATSLSDKAVAKTIEEQVSCNYQALYYVPGVNIIAAFFPLCYAEIKQAVFTGAGARVVTDKAHVGVGEERQGVGAYWINSSQCKAGKCTACPNWPTEEKCGNAGLGGNACIQMQGERPDCGKAGSTTP